MMQSDAAWAAGRDVRKFLAGAHAAGQVGCYRTAPKGVGLLPAIVVTALVSMLAVIAGQAVFGW